MRLKMGSQVFDDVKVPVLWDTRAVLQDRHGRLSIVDLGGSVARVEVVGDVPAPGVDYRPVIDGYVILSGLQDLYQFDPVRHRLTALSLDLPDCEITPTETRIGTIVLSNSLVSGFGVGILISSGGGVSIGAPLPGGLAALQVA